MKKKHLRNLLIGASAIAGIVCSTQANAKQQCYEFQKSSKFLTPTEVETIIKKGSKSDKNALSCAAKTMSSCSGGWSNDKAFETAGLSSTILQSFCNSAD